MYTDVYIYIYIYIIYICKRTADYGERLGAVLETGMNEKRTKEKRTKRFNRAAD